MTVRQQFKETHLVITTHSKKSICMFIQCYNMHNIAIWPTTTIADIRGKILAGEKLMILVNC